ncbi:hypothetical protein [Paenibacillus sp. DCT19]|uniref:hypothetical protein n=1 Tax=Paenibacillus sp. DCT19 TaxID=2211212 RepID=UPI000FE1F1F6|nr:hypothetical protein [Paenibacillus sp. DCT19]
MSLVTVSYEQLQIQPFDIRIHEVTLLMKVHDHGKLTFTGVIPEEKEEQYVRMADESTPVELFYTDEQGQKQRLFHGIILKLHVKVENKVYWLEAELCPIRMQWISAQNTFLSKYKYLILTLCRRLVGSIRMDRSSIHLLRKKSWVRIHYNIKKPIGSS